MLVAFADTATVNEPDQDNGSGDEWVTIAEAARRLCISERQAHRDAKRLSDNDRQTPDKGATRLFPPKIV